MNLKKLMKKGSLGLIALAFVTSVAFAYFTDQETKTNVFTVGSVKIELEEPHWPGEDPEDETEKNLTPLQVVKKDPQVSNTGSNDAYIYLEVTLPKATVATANEDGTKNDVMNQALFTYSINENWKELIDYKLEDEKSVTYVYAYEKALAPSFTTNPLFDEVQLINLIEGQEIEMTQHIDVHAKAIQASGTGSVEEAYTKLMNQMA